MNIEQLKKQARNLRKAFPDLVAINGGRLTLAHAQATIARINGYPSWEQLVHKCADSTNSASTSSGRTIEFILRRGLLFDVDGEVTKLPIAYSITTGEPTCYEMACEANLRLKHPHDEDVVRAEEEALYEFLDGIRGNSFDQGFTSIAPVALEQFAARIQLSLERAPLNIEGHSLLVGVMHTLGHHQEAVAVSEPIVSTLIDLLPKGRKVQVPYGFLSNRPFFRLLQSHLLALGEIGKHADADRLANLGLRLCPNDNIGFRYIRTRSLRASARKA